MPEPLAVAPQSLTRAEWLALLSAPATPPEEKPAAAPVDPAVAKWLATLTGFRDQLQKAIDATYQVRNASMDQLAKLVTLDPSDRDALAAQAAAAGKAIRAYRDSLDQLAEVGASYCEAATQKPADAAGDATPIATKALP